MAKISKFGLLEMSRQRISPPVGEGAFEPCDHCDGTGITKTESIKVLEVLRKIQEMLSTNKVKVLKVKIDSRTVGYILNNKKQYLFELESKHDARVFFYGRDDLRIENFTFEIEEIRDEKPPEIKAKRGRPSKEATRTDKKKISHSIKEEHTSYMGEKVDTSVGSAEAEKKESQNSKGKVTRRKYARRPVGKRSSPGRVRSKKHMAQEKSKVSDINKPHESKEISRSETFNQKNGMDVISQPAERPIHDSPESL